MYKYLIVLESFLIVFLTILALDGKNRYDDISAKQTAIIRALEGK